MGKTLVVITGPTAAGKTDVALDIAKAYGVPVVNADSRQIYRGMETGTAAPTREQMADVKHYFVGILPPDATYSASMYESDALRLLDRLFAESDVALMCGGSMMYIDSVCNGLDDMPSVRPDIRADLMDTLRDDGLNALLGELAAADPEYYEAVDRNNWRRVVHALEVCRQTGRPFSSFRKGTRAPRPFRVVKICVTRPREELYDRINARVDRMMSSGLLDEVRRLAPYRGSNALNTVGYKELFDYIDGRTTLEDAVTRIKSDTRRYARKQLTWYRRQNDVLWVHPDDMEQIMRHISANV